MAEQRLRNEFNSRCNLVAYYLSREAHDFTSLESHDVRSSEAAFIAAGTLLFQRAGRMAPARRPKAMTVERVNRHGAGTTSRVATEVPIEVLLQEVKDLPGYAEWRRGLSREDYEVKGQKFPPPALTRKVADPLFKQISTANTNIPGYLRKEKGDAARHTQNLREVRFAGWFFCRTPVVMSLDDVALAAALLQQGVDRARRENVDATNDRLSHTLEVLYLKNENLTFEINSLTGEAVPQLAPEDQVCFFISVAKPEKVLSLLSLFAFTCIFFLRRKCCHCSCVPLLGQVPVRLLLLIRFV